MSASTSNQKHHIWKTTAHKPQTQGLRHIRVQVTHIERGKLGNCASTVTMEPATTHGKRFKPCRLQPPGAAMIEDSPERFPQLCEWGNQKPIWTCSGCSGCYDCKQRHLYPQHLENGIYCQVGLAWNLDLQHNCRPRHLFLGFPFAIFFCLSKLALTKRQKTSLQHHPRLLWIQLAHAKFGQKAEVSGAWKKKIDTGWQLLSYLRNRIIQQA